MREGSYAPASLGHGKVMEIIPPFVSERVDQGVFIEQWERDGQEAVAMALEVRAWRIGKRDMLALDMFLRVS